MKNVIIYLIFIISFLNIIFYHFIKKPKGLKGMRGDKGDKGESGDQGPPGNEGPVGYSGSKGILGSEIGSVGEKGEKGDFGDKGDIGIKGLKGLKGIREDQGVKGEDGDKGPSGKIGDKGVKGPQRIIGNFSDLDIIADKSKCVKLSDKLECPKDSVIFDMTFDKNNLIKDITCCKIMIDNILIQKINNRNRIIEKLTLKLSEFKQNISSYENTYIPKNKYHEILKEYDSRSLEIIKNNIGLIETLISGIQSLKSLREMSEENMFNLIGVQSKVDEIKIYSKDEEENINKIYGSITNYEYYILSLITLIFRSDEEGVEITDYSYLIKQIYDFPRNDINDLIKYTSL